MEAQREKQEYRKVSEEIFQIMITILICIVKRLNKC